MHQLALALGMPVHQLMNMPCTELDDWMTYHMTCEPISLDRWDAMLAQLCACIYNAAPGRKRGKHFKPAQFMPRWSRPQKSPAQMWAMMTAFARRHNARMGARNGSD